MVTPLQSNTKPALGNLDVTYFFKPIAPLDSQAHLSLNDADNKARIEDERLQDWRRMMIQMRAKH